ncbi:MAG: DNA repair protein RecN [Lachnospiraceae bacterium]|nr:DNA repair protein RecN [Lachnospiraceae bacterium]
MLRNLHIKNLALIKEVDVDFSDGLNILTGETGSGKSIIVESISLALGGRAQRDMGRGSSGPGLIELVFEVSDRSSLEKLREHGIEPEDGVVLVSRRIADGRSQCRINGESRTSAEVREIAGCFLDIHGQSEHQKLLRQDCQLDLLDAFGRGEIAAAKEKVAADYKIFIGIKKALGGAEISADERARRASFLTYEIEEIENADLQDGEDEEVEKRYRKLANAKKIAESVDSVHEATGYDSAESAGEVIGRALRKLESVSEYDDDLRGFYDSLNEIDSLLNDFNRSLSEYAGDLAFEADSFEETEERLNVINRLKAKYGRTVEDILAGLNEKKEELHRLEDYEENRERLLREYASARERLQKSSSELTALRKKYAVTFAMAASKEFRELNFARADFGIEFRECGSFSANGCDNIEFMIATNPGEEKRPLRNVVSGGELSRLMLGIRTMFADQDDTETMIFDEVDTGISGRTAQMAAEKLARVSRHHQVLCITHLPQIAAMADTHYGITKALSDSEAITNIEALSGEESVNELARLIGGASITANTRTSAREMKEMCDRFKKDMQLRK